MSQLRAPEARNDRPEGGRHGRTGSRPASRPGPSPAPSARRSRSVPPTPEVRIRPQLLRTAILPTVVAALSGTAAVVYTIHSAGVHPSVALRGVLAGCAALAAAAMAAAALGADRVTRTVLDRCTALRRSSVRGQADLRGVVDRLSRGEAPPGGRGGTAGPSRGDAFDLLALELNRAQEAAVESVVRAARIAPPAVTTVDEQKVEVFVNLARRLQSLVHREIQLLDELEYQVEDPELLKGLFQVDHLATRIRRHAENLAVLGGAISRRQWSNPVSLTEVMRSAVAEVEQYPRVKLVPPVDGTLRGHAVADVIHLLAELVENATVFSAPHTQVLLRAQHVTAGLAVEVEDRGLGMSVTETDRMNALLAEPDQVNVGHLLQDGRIGLYVVAALARRHGVSVRLQTNIYGGVQAVLVLPAALLGADENGLQTGAAGRIPHPQQPQQSPQAQQVSQAYQDPPAHPDPLARRAPLTPQDPLTHPDPLRPGPRTADALLQAGPHSSIAPDELAAPSGRSAPPLPVREPEGTRPNPAAALPGAHHGPPPDTGAVTDGARYDTGPVPLLSPADRPDLPRRRSQQHLVPQLKDAPAPRTDEEHPAVHDPGLMAAFQRGISLAEAEPERPDRERPDRERPDGGRLPHRDDDFPGGSPDGFSDDSSKEEMHHGE
ncbi:sensor histidine kinase KdpD [Streptomyces sp. NBC_01306]|uniref:sensor histidine kinase n=1 Tax=Streptomyces sp. NBC_01306 TaxID=2903819 RepID=UPI00225952E5|nr:ATP-binding protein [Streptomyces sp. NBC_01306]MCX4722557.1 ATP-binding protein [Streptomyces sp. NBC_01306]